MADPRSPLLRLQADLLRHVRRRGLTTDDALAAELTALGHPCDRTTLVRYRKGERTAPLGLLQVILDHVDEPREVLEHLAAPHGLRVESAEEATVEGDLSDAILELAELVGAVARVVRAGGPGAEGLDGRLQHLVSELRQAIGPRAVS